jgi:uncharacterized protein DUF3617
MNTPNLPACAALIALTTVFVGASAHAEDLQSGKWEFDVRIDTTKMHLSPGVRLPPGVQLPGRPGRGASHTACITPERMVPGPALLNQCAFDWITHSGGTVKWSVTCNSSDGQVRDSGIATYSGNKMEGTMYIRSIGGHGPPFDITQRISGRYLGPCD